MALTFLDVLSSTQPESSESARDTQTAGGAVSSRHRGLRFIMKICALHIKEAEL